MKKQKKPNKSNLKSKPTVFSEPISRRKPISKSEPINTSEPHLKSEPFVISKPTTISDTQPYASAKLGHKHISSWKEAVLANMSRGEKVSQSERENHYISASQKVNENHTFKASHLSNENRLEIASNPPKSLMHADLRARRKMIKIFLAHYWQACKELSSQLISENHAEEASQADNENHYISASQKVNENQELLASQEIKENHQTTASQNILRELGRLTANSFYEHQEVRIKEFNRIRDIIRRRMENLPLVGKVEEKKEDEDKHKEKFVDKKIPIYLRQLVEQGKLTPKEEEYINNVLEVQKNAEKYEVLYKGLMQEYIEGEDIYNEFLKHIKGISTILSANLIKEFGYCEKAPHISSLWKFTGFHVINGNAPKRKKGEKLDFSLKLRTMCWKIGDSFIKQRTPFYRDIYDNEKARQVAMLPKEGDDKIRQMLTEGIEEFDSGEVNNETKMP